MKTLTLYESLMEVELEKSIARENRRTRTGIAVDTDKYALVYQRWDRLYVKLDRHILRRLGGEDREPEQFCWYCGHLYGYCLSDCKRHIREDE